jgi:hypothetical protein
MQFILDEINARYKQALKSATCSYPDFCQALEQRGIHLVPKVQLVNGALAITGLHYQCLDARGKLYSLKASALGSKHTWRKLQQMGITFDPNDEATAQLVLNQTANGAGIRALASKPDVISIQKLVHQAQIKAALDAANAQMAAREPVVPPVSISSKPITSVAPIVDVTPKIEVPIKKVAPPKIKRRM